MSLRLSVVGLVGLFVLALPFGRPSTQAAPPPVDGRPNIILLVLDDQDAFTPFWDAMPQTAAMIRDRGVEFRRGFAPTPICTAGRATLVSGKLAHNTGVYTIEGPFGIGAFAGQKSNTIATALDSLGYVNAMIGKMWGNGPIEPGWSYWCALGGPHMYEGYGYDVNEQSRSGKSRQYKSGQYSTDFLSDKVSAFLDDPSVSGAPFFLWLAPTAPHLPLAPAQRHVQDAQFLWKGALPEKSNFNEPDLSDKSAWLRNTGRVRSAAVPFASNEYWKRMGSLMAVDEMMGRIHDQLVARGKWDRTVLVLVSDNGYNLGAHRLIHKMAPYEESIRVPILFAGPGIANDQVDRIVGLHDIAPTLLDIAGGPANSSMDGKSLLPFLRNGSRADVPNWRTSLVTEYQTGGVHPGYAPAGPMRAGYMLDIPTYRSLRTDNYKYIYWSQTGEEELYDLNLDPDENANLLYLAPDLYAGTHEMLRDRLFREMNLGGASNP